MSSFNLDIETAITKTKLTLEYLEQKKEARLTQAAEKLVGERKGPFSRER